MKVKIQKLTNNAVIPSYAKPGDAGLDLVAVTKSFDNDIVIYGTGLAIEIPKGYVGLVFPRSSLSNKSMILGNHVGVIDSGYRGEIILKFRATGGNLYNIGDKIGQLIIIPYPKIDLIESKSLSESERGTKGFGSTGK